MSSFVKGIFGSNNSGSSAAGAQNEAIDRAIAEMRRQFSETSENLSPFMDIGKDALPQQAMNATLGGLNSNLGNIFDSDIFNSLVDERSRAVQGQLAAGGLTRSGTAINEMSAIPTNIGLAIEELLSGRVTGLAGSGQNAAAGLGSLGAQSSGGIANLLMQQGQNTGSGILANAQAGAAQGAQQGQMLATAASMFFSDPALKMNVEPVSNIKDLTVYQWDWKPETKGTMVEKCGTIGFMADEVQELYPQHVYTIKELGGFMVIDYPALLDELEAA